jgi:Zn-dependent metalloprotease
MFQKIVLYAIFLFICVNSSSLSAQVLEGHLASQKIKNAKKVWLDEKNSSIKYIEFLVPENVDENKHSKWLCQLLNCPSNVEFKLIRKINDQIGQTHYRYAQHIDGYLIEGAQYLVHKRKHQILSVNGALHTAKTLVSTASISEANALSYAQKSVPSNNYLWEAEKSFPPKGTLVLVGNEGTYRLAYKFDIYSLDPLGRYYVFVDANSGEIVQKTSRIHNSATPGVAHTKYSGIQSIITDSVGPGMYILKDVTRNIHTRDLNTSQIISTGVDFTDTDNVWTSTINQDDAALDAHWGAAKTYDYFLNIHGLNSYDGLGSSINSYVHYGNNVFNAFWDGTQMLYGDGDGVTSTALTSIDIVGHEIAHGVTEFSANLVYQNEPGALNESFSDIFGVAIDFYANPTTANWYMGDQINLVSNGFRNMADPNEMGHPDTYLGTNWYIGGLDYGGVHTNSGVQNFWFYLLTLGGTGVNDIGNAYSVTGLGTIDAARIAYRNLSVYLITSSEYADARFYAIQSASDLFGTCSMEEEATANAWYAVGVGGLYSNSVSASFNAAPIYSCTTPATVNFNNTSTNDSISLWYFGDGTSSTLTNPSHTYTTVGTYDVTLIIAGSSICGGGVDTLVLPNYITITNTGGPILATCTPSATTGAPNYGIFNYTFNTINNSTGSSLDGYQDYSCSHQTTVSAGDFVNLSINAGIYNANVAVYIDYDNNGLFNASEQIYTNTGLSPHVGTIMIPASTVQNVPLRMRVISDIYTITNSCNGSMTQSQIEDYSITIQPVSTPPIANFVGNPTTINIGNTVTFTDNSSGLPSAYLWSFPNGSPASSTAANPVVTYATLGTYDAQLIVTNTFGSDTLLRSNYISVVNTVNMCSSATSTTGTSGLLYDSGGSVGSYSNNENCYFLIQPTCADSIFLDFTAFSTESCCDYIRIYDGTTTAGTLIYEARGNALPARAIATSGAMYIYFHTDGSVVSSGFAANWSTVETVSTPLTASFAVSNLNPVFGTPVSFTDQSTNSPSSWIWDFGDGNISTDQNPMNAYFSSGLHTIQLIASTCGFSDTTSLVINVQGPPIIEVNPDSLSVTISCGDSITVPIVVRNIGNGPLHYSTNPTGGGSGGSVNVVAWTYGVDYGGEYTNTINGLNNYYTNYTLTETTTTNPATLQSFLSTADVLLIAEQETASFLILQGMAPTLQNYVNNGGWIIVCGNDYTDINALGLFNISTGINASGGVQTIVDANSPLLANTTAPINMLNATFYGTFSNIGFNTVTSYTGSSVIGDLDIGSGKAIYIGFDYFQNTPNSDQIIANAVEWASMSTRTPWISNSPDSGIVVGGDSMLVDVIINGSGMTGGIYNGSLVFQSNDSLNPTLHIPVHLTITGTPSIAFSENCVLFDSTMQFTTDTAGVWVYNTGCDSLRITNIVASNADVNTDSSNFVVGPYDSTYVNFIFSPDTAQNYTGSITFFSNAGDSTICFDAYSNGAPIIVVNPDSLSVTINCGDSITVPIMISNIGSGPLHFTTNSAGGSSGSVNVVAWTYGVDYGGEYSNTINGLNNYYTNYTLTETATIDPSILQSFLSTADVLLIAEQEFASILTLQGMAPTLQNYVNNGGWVIVCGNDYTDINALGLFNISTGSNASGAAQAIVDPSSPLLANTTPPINMTNATYYGTFTNPGFNTVTSYVGSSVVGDLDIGLGKAIYIGFDYFVNTPNIDQIIANAVEWASTGASTAWISTNPDNGTVLAGDSMLVDVIINGSGMTGGIYNGSLVLQSNDPVNPLFTVPVHLSITGTPSIAFSENCVLFDSTMQFTTDTAGIWVYNTGCDSLRITNIVASNADVNADSSNFVVGPYDSTYVNFIFSPDTAQNYTGSITFFSNAGDSTICFDAYSIGAPIIVVNPDSLSVTINCGDSITVPIMISNVGSGPLHYTTNSTGGSSGSVNVVAWTYGVDYSGEYTNTINGLNNYYTNYTLTETATTNPATLQSFLSTADVLLIAEQETASFLILQGMAPTLQNYVNNGGWIIVCGNDYTDINALGLFNLSSGTNTSGGTQLIVDPSSPLLANTTAPLNMTNATFYGTFTNSGFNTVTSYVGSSVVGDLDIGLGKAIYIGFDYFVNTPNIDRIIANAVEWASTSRTTAWISTNPDNGTILAGDSMLVDVTINGSGLSGGIYNGNLVLQSNDPINPLLSIPVHLTIIEEPNIDFSENCVLFDSTMQFTNDTAGIWVYNTGCDILQISNITTTNADVNSLISSLIIPANDSFYVNFVFSPTLIQAYSGSITFFSNAGDSTICFAGNGIGAPLIDVNPDSIFVTINCEDSVVVPLTISNIGTGTLAYNNTAMNAWLALSSNSGTLASGGSNTGDVIIYGTGLAGGVYTSSILVASNDPSTPTLTIPVILTVERNAILGVSDSCINLGSVVQNVSGMDSVLVSNTGCEAMYITNVLSNSSALVGTVDAVIVPPGQSAWLQVTYTSNVLGVFNATITIVTANQDTSICVYGIITTANDVKQLDGSEAIAKIYPNPNNGDFTFYYEGDSKAINLNLYGVNGQLIISKEHQVTKSLLVNFSDLNLSEGVYYLEMISDKETKTLELIVIKP